VRSPAELMQAAIATQGCGPQTGPGRRRHAYSLVARARRRRPRGGLRPIADKVVAPLIENAAKANALTVKLVRAVIEQESAFRPCAVSSKAPRA